MLALGPFSYAPILIYSHLVLNVLFVRALQDRIPSSHPLVVTSVDPGFCISELRRNIPAAEYAELEKTARTAEEGSRQLLYAALGPDPTKLDSDETTSVMRGAYVSNVEVVAPHPILETEAGAELQRRIWVSHVHSWRLG